MQGEYANEHQCLYSYSPSRLKLQRKQMISKVQSSIVRVRLKKMLIVAKKIEPRIVQDLNLIKRVDA